jgi:hypothetical protein
MQDAELWVDRKVIIIVQHANKTLIDHFFRPKSDHAEEPLIIIRSSNTLDSTKT